MKREQRGEGTVGDRVERVDKREKRREQNELASSCRPVSEELGSSSTILDLTIYVHSTSVQCQTEVLCPLCRESGSKAEEVRVVDMCEVHLTFMQETRLCLNQCWAVQL